MGKKSKRRFAGTSRKSRSAVTAAASTAPVQFLLPAPLGEMKWGATWSVCLPQMTADQIEESAELGPPKFSLKGIISSKETPHECALCSDYLELMAHGGWITECCGKRGCKKCFDLRATELASFLPPGSNGGHREGCKDHRLFFQERLCRIGKG